MDRQQTKQVLGILKASYPLVFRNMSKGEADNMLKIWQIKFQNAPFELVNMAVDHFVTFYPNGIDISIARINLIIIDLITNNSKEECEEIVPKLMKTITRHGSAGLTEEIVTKEVSPHLLTAFPLGTIKQWGREPMSDYTRNEIVRACRDAKKNFEQAQIAQGNYAAIADPTKLEALGLSDCLKIEMEK